MVITDIIIFKLSVMLCSIANTIIHDYLTWQANYIYRCNLIHMILTYSSPVKQEDFSFIKFSERQDIVCRLD